MLFVRPLNKTLEPTPRCTQTNKTREGRSGRYLNIQKNDSQHGFLLLSRSGYTMTKRLAPPVAFSLLASNITPPSCIRIRGAAINLDQKLVLQLLGIKTSRPKHSLSSEANNTSVIITTAKQPSARQAFFTCVFSDAISSFF
jgi:hypothetical protein